LRAETAFHPRTSPASPTPPMGRTTA
jgi:hypothetical protein